MNIESIGKYIRLYRTKKKMTQEKLAEYADVSPAYISMMERSEKYSALITLIKIANALDVTPDMILCETLNREYEMKRAVMLDDISELPKREQERIIAMVNLMIEEAKK